MNEYIHSHLSYDQIILDEQPTMPCEQQASVRKMSKQKPFFIHKTSNVNSKKYEPSTNLKVQSEESENKLSLNPENGQFQQQQFYQQSVHSSSCKQSTNKYDQDFEQYQEPQQQFQRYTEQKRKIQIKKISQQLGKTRKKQNYSAILPKINKIIPTNKKLQNNNRYSYVQSFSKADFQYLAKSTVQLRQQNHKLIENIEQYRKIMPIFKKNMKVIQQQSLQLKKMKCKQNKFFDVGYQLNLDKNVEINQIKVQATSSKINEIESGIKYRHKLKRNKIIRFNVSKDKSFQQQYNIFEDINKVREQLLYKKRQEQIHNKKIVQMQCKIASYQQMIQKLEERSKVGIHQQLKRRKLVVEYDIQMKKTQINQRQCELLMEIAQLNNKNSQIQIQSSKINSQNSTLLIKLMQNQSKMNNKHNGQSKNKEIIPQQVIPQKNMKRILNLFNRGRRG